MILRTMLRLSAWYCAIVAVMGATIVLLCVAYRLVTGRWP